MQKPENNWINVAKWYLASIIFLLFFGCTTTEEKPELFVPEYSAVSVSSPLFTPSTGQSFAWYSPVTIATGTEKVDAFLKQHVIPSINKHLVGRGYRVVEEQSQADYIIGFAIANNYSARSTQLSNFFHLFPSINDLDETHQYATAFVGVIDRRDLPLVEAGVNTELLLWRSSIEAFAVGEDFPEELRMHRLQYLVNTLMKSFP